MSKTTNEALSFIKEKGRVSYQSVCEHVFKGDSAAFYESLSYLKENGFIKTRETDQRTLHTCFATITDKGTASSLLETDRKRSRRARIIETIIAAVVGGVIVLLVEHLLF